MLLLIAGHPRSGTTMLQRLCAGHPQIGLTNEFGILNGLGLSRLAYSRLALQNWQKVRHRWAFHPADAPLPQHYEWRNLRFVLGHVAAVWRYGRSPVTLPVITKAYLHAFPGKTIVGDKLPHYIFTMEKLVPYDDLKRVVIYRDCRDVTSSFLKQARTTWAKMPWVHYVDTAEKIATRWVRTINLMHTHQSQLFIMRYETLAAQPDQELNRLAAYLDVDTAGFDAGLVSDRSIGNYRQGLTAVELADVMRVAGETMARLGYT
ncbi:MAG: hypothetical protein Kow0080_28980 [Candidatus Promineifilaceae bacterium]